MKMLLFTVAATAALLSPLAAAPAFAQYRGDDNRGQQSQHDDRRDERGQDNRGQDQRRDGRGWQAEDSHRGDRQDEARRSDRRDHRERGRSWRDDRADARYEDSMHNGYYLGNRWYYGPPPQARYGNRGLHLGYRPWARGQRLGYYNNRYTEVDYREHRLRQPPRGYHWVRDNDGDYLLAAVVSGVIAQVILGNSRR